MKTKMTLGILAASVWLFSAGVEAGEGEERQAGKRRRGAHQARHHGPQARGGPLKKILEHREDWDLSDEQANSLQKLMEGSKQDAEKVFGKMREARQNLHKSARGEKVDEDGIKDAAKELGKAVTEMAKFRKKQQENLFEILNDQQKEKLKEKRAQMRQRNRKDRGRHGRGGPQAPPNEAGGKAAEKDF